MSLISYALVNDIYQLPDFLSNTSLQSKPSMLNDYSPGRDISDVSEFHQIRRQTIINLIVSTLNEKMNNHNRYADIMGVTYDFYLPEISNSAWINSIDDVSIMAFVQGIPTGNKTYYNSYALGASRIIRKNYVYGTQNGSVKLYHEADCEDIAGKIDSDGFPIDTTITELFLNKVEAAKAGYYPCLGKTVVLVPPPAGGGSPETPEVSPSPSPEEPAVYVYNISYELNGGSATNPSSYTPQTETFTLNNPTKGGYIFKGWTGANGTTPQKTVTIAKGSIGNRTYKANWVQTICNACGHDEHSGACTVEITVNYTCTDGSRTWVTCNDCSGDGLVDSSCRTCGGNGIIACSSHGKEKDHPASYSCTSCDGGWVSTSTTIENGETCPTCDGSGKKCDGSCSKTETIISYYDCPSCGKKNGGVYKSISCSCGLSGYGDGCGCGYLGSRNTNLHGGSDNKCGTCGGDGKVNKVETSSTRCGTCNGDGWVDYICTAWSNCTNCGKDGIIENSKTCDTCDGHGGSYSYNYCEHTQWIEHPATKQEICGCTSE